MHPEDLLLVLCVHGTRHCWDRLIWVTDVAEFLATQPQVDWSALLDHSQRLRARRMLLLGLLLAREYFGATLPSIVHDQIQDDLPALHKLSSEWFMRLQKQSSDEGLLRKAVFHLRCRERWSDRFRYILRLGTTTTIEDWRVVNLPESLSFFYLLFRLPRLFRKYRSVRVNQTS
jgi:hypothetical protein